MEPFLPGRENHQADWRPIYHDSSYETGQGLKTHRIQRLEERDGGTYYYTEDVFWGLLTPLVMAIYEKDIQRGFDEVAEALKRESEK
jgi:hypothetical protein